MVNQRIGEKMSRPYSDKLLVELSRNDSDSIGLSLARLCVKLNLPMMHLAKALNVSRWTLHKWFRGEVISSRYKKDLEVAYEIISEAEKNEKLPAPRKVAKEFILNNINFSIH